MNQIVYDHSFEGFLCAVFAFYNQKEKNGSIVRSDYVQPSLFGNVIMVGTEPHKAERVWNGLERKAGKRVLKMLYRVFLSELPERERVMLEVIQRAFNIGSGVLGEWHLPEVMRLQEIDKMIGREKHRFEAFVRFRKLKDGRYYALIDPDFDILPLILPHFISRYADQHWIIHDVKRQYAIAFDTIHWQVIRFESEGRIIQDIPNSEWDDSEHEYDQLWRTYFQAVNIPLRKNTKLHIQHVPRRYWKYLWEKRGAFYE